MSIDQQFIMEMALADKAMEKLKYRADIDGLRAIAVIGVLLFHAGISFTGGFVGVDIFFVISGFLITNLILQAQRNNRFSIRVFLGRRVRRLMPAALVMTTSTLLVGYWWLVPDDYDKLAESAIAQIALVSNIYFANSFNYFAGPAELVPLLHTWSATNLLPSLLAKKTMYYFGFPHSSLLWLELVDHEHLSNKSILSITNASLGITSRRSARFCPQTKAGTKIVS
jgi:hypothetical protein